MPKTLIAKNIVSCNQLTFETKDNTVIGCKCSAEINYGERGCNHDVNLWPLMPAPVRDKFQQVYDYIHNLVEGQFIQ